MALIRGAEPFLLPGSEYGVLLVHGFTGSPSEMRLLGDYLHGLGYTVLAPRLCGHGTDIKEMEKTQWLHWYSAVEDGYHLLKSICKNIAVVGLSMGGLLALKLAAEYPVIKLASLSAPIYIADNRLTMLPLFRTFQRYTTKQKRKHFDVDPIYSIYYDQMPLTSVSSLLDLIEHVQNLLPRVTVPALVIQSRNEKTVRLESATYIYEHLGSTDKKLIWLENSGHILTLDIEREQVFNHIVEFLRDEG